MAYGTYDRSPPPFFRQGPSALTRLVVFSALAVLAMVLDVRFQITPPLRQALAVVVYPLQEVAQAPIQWGRRIGASMQTTVDAQRRIDELEKNNVTLELQAQVGAQLRVENDRLRELLQLQKSLPPHSIAAQISAQAADPFTRKVDINRGSVRGIKSGSPVVDQTGLLGQVTSVYPWSSEVTLITDRDAAVPIQIQRTGERGVVYGDPTQGRTGMELRWMPTGADVRAGDLLVTSGVDGIYPAGLRVARVVSVQRQRDAAFARVLCAPLADVDAGRHVLVLAPLSPLVPPPGSAGSAPAQSPPRAWGSRPYPH